ncbi:MAG: mycothione reductase [Nocardioidaceae bacterium]|nr:mycothione reductase [Nocardioidaceae bacterium]
MTHYDLAVIGTGSGNSIVNHEFAGQKVAILERGTFGGTCLNVGCIPTKMFVYPADLARQAVHGPELGVHTSFTDADWPAIRDRIFARIDPIAAAGKEYREGLPNVDVYTGSCRFVGERRIDTGTGVEITADQVVIAAGSRVHLPDLPGLDTVEHHTSDTVMRLETFPARVGIVGGGFIGAEFAHVFSAYGAHVTQVHRGPRLLTAEDADVSARFTEIAQRQWDVLLSTRITSVARTATGIRMDLSQGEPVEVDVLLFATGRIPNGDQLDLHTTGVELDDAGRVVVDEHQRTTADGIWALGDASSPDQLKHVANQDARIVQHNLLHPDDLRVSDHRFVPQAVFTSPQIASVGLSEQPARDAGHDVATSTQDYADVAYGWAMEDSGHFVKLVADRSTGTLLGAHLIGPQASILIQPLVQAMSFGQPLADLARGQYWIHPALAEVVENALLGIESVLR